MTKIMRLGRRATLATSLLAAALAVGPADAPAAAVFTPVGPASPAADLARSISFHPSGEYLAAAGGPAPLSRFAVLQAAALKPLTPSSACAGSSVAFKPTGSVLAAAHSSESTVTLCSVSRTDGSITPLGSPLPTGTTPTSVQFSRDGRLLATTDRDAGTISMFTVGTTTLAPVNDGEAFFAEFEITSATFSPDGRFLVVTSGCPVRLTLSVFAIAADGSLTKVDAENPPLGCARDVAFTGSGNDLIALSADRYTPFQGELRPYSLSDSGQISAPGVATPAGTAPRDVAISPDGKVVAYTSYEQDTLTVLRRTASGALVPAMTVAAGDGPSALSFSADGRMLAITTAADDRVSLFRVAPGPSLLRAGAPTALDGAANNLAISSTGRVAVSTFDQDGVELFTLSGTGLLAPTAQLMPPAVTEPHSVAFSPNGSLLAVTSGSDRLTTYGVSGAGALTQAGTATTGTHPIRAAFSPDGSLIATANFFADSISLFSVAGDGTLTPRTSVATGEGPISLAFSPDGSLLLAAAQSGGRLDVYGVSGTTLTAKPPIATSANPQAIAFRPGGGQLALVDYVTGNLTTHSISGAGAATLVDQEPVGTPERVAYSPSGDFIAVTGDPGDLRMFSVSPAGALTPFGDVTKTDMFPSGLAFDPTGRFLLIPQISGRSVWVYPLAAPVMDTVVDSGPPPFDIQAAPSFVFDASYPSTYECKLDSGPYQPCGPRPSIAVSGDGPHTLSVRARDARGNADPTPAAYSWTTDRAAPTAPAPALPLDGAANLAPSVDLSWSPSTDGLSGVASYELTVDGSLRATLAAGSCTPTCTARVNDLGDGAHTWQVRALDVAGNEAAGPRRTFSVDATPPAAVRLLAPAEGARLATARPDVTWSPAADGGSPIVGYDVALDRGEPVRRTTAAWGPDRPLPDGPHSVSVVAVDAIGLRSPSVTRSFHVDTTPPTAALKVGPSRFRAPFDVVFDASQSSDPAGRITRYEFDLDGDGSFELAQGPVVRRVLSLPGLHTAAVRVTDEVGLTSVARATTEAEAALAPGGTRAAYVTIDGGAAFTRDDDVELEINPPERRGAVTMVISNDGKPNERTAKPISTVVRWPLEPGDGKRDRRNVYVTFYNAAGAALERVQDDIRYDPTPPRIERAVVRRTGATRGQLRVTARDAGSGLARVLVRGGRRTLAATRTWRRVVPLRGRLGARVTVTVYDRAKNRATRTVRVTAAARRRLG